MCGQGERGCSPARAAANAPKAQVSKRATAHNGGGDPAITASRAGLGPNTLRTCGTQSVAALSVEADALWTTLTALSVWSADDAKREFEAAITRIHDFEKLLHQLLTDTEDPATFSQQFARAMQACEADLKLLRDDHGADLQVLNDDPSVKAIIATYLVANEAAAETRMPAPVRPLSRSSSPSSPRPRARRAPERPNRGAITRSPEA